MTSPHASPPQHDVSGLINAIARNTEPGCLGKNLDSYRWKVLADYVQPAAFKQGELVIGQGENDRRLYFVESGDLKVNVRTDKGIVHLALVGPGSVVGEGCFFSRLARSASVSAYSDCKVWFMLPADFERLSRANAHVALALSMALGTLMATRMLDLSKRVAVI
jgi:CRP-like cAMP-binding protein